MKRSTRAAIRLGVETGLLYVVYHETGWATTLLLILWAIRHEVDAFVIYHVFDKIANNLRIVKGDTND